MEISKEEYFTRRKLLVEEFVQEVWENLRIADLEKPVGILIETAPELEMGPGNPYRYRPGSEMYYYTGWEQPDATLLLTFNGETSRESGKLSGNESSEMNERETNNNHMSNESNNEYTSELWVLPKDPKREVWTGPRLSLEKAREVTHVDKTFPMNPDGLKILQEKIQKIINNDGVIGCFSYGKGKTWDILLKLDRVDKTNSIYNINLLIDRLRLVKSPAEIKRLEEVCKISSRAFIEMIRKTYPSMREAFLDALFHFEVIKQGCPRLAYPCIVGSGANGTILHYEKNQGVLRNGQLVLVDAGGEKNMMSADITRTWPTNGEFTEPQGEIYELVLKAQKTCISMVKPGMTLNKMQDAVYEIFREGLTKLRVITLADSGDHKLMNKVVQKYYPHSVGHWLGMEVHDCYRDSEAQKEIPFEPGFCLTVEPGLYFPDTEGVPARYRGIGIRIEDDLVVTKDGNRVLSSGVPKELAEIEKLVGS